MCDDGEITPALLLSKALGIPVLCTQWLIDAIPMGCFTDNLDGYFHPRYGMAACVGESTLSVPDEVTEDTREGILGNHSDGNSSLYFEENVGPYYKPLFVGLTILFLSESFSEHASMFKHIVRLLGGTATLSTSALNISVIVNLSYGATHRPNHTTDGGFNEKNTKEGSGVEARSTKGNKKNNKKQPPREVSDSVLNIATPVEHIPLSITYPGVSFCAQGGVMGIASCRNNEVTKFTCVQRVLKLRASSGLNTPPVVSVEWFVNCILQGRVVDTARYTIPTAAEECVVPVKRHVANPSTAYVGDNVNVPVESE
uniref:Uncharacterized protein TCIL3000_3_740 n=1 Tax=Trypanosoma congolense (strain IL3000) TaxID=1068625 RepID=G0UJU8_TRYCI|nr:unnamed protein product [Trypanosoma congolense IL3000]